MKRPNIQPQQCTPVQTEIKAVCVRHLKTHDRVSIDAGTGAGKTKAELEILSHFAPGQMVGMTANRRQLLLQHALYAYNDFAPELDVEFLIVCTGVNLKGDVGDEVFAQHNFRVSSDPKEIAEFMSKHRTPQESAMILWTIQSNPTIAESCDIAKKQFAAVAVDEAHNLQGDDLDKKNARESQMLLHNKHIPIVKRIFATGTPPLGAHMDEETRSHIAKSVGVQIKEDENSMNNAEVFGKFVYRLPVPAGIDRADVPISDYRIVPHYVRKSDLDVIRDPKNGLPFAQMEEYEAASLYCLLDLQKNRPEYQITHVIDYHDRVKKAKATYEALQELAKHAQPGDPTIRPFYMDGDTPVEKRPAILQSLSAGTDKDLSIAEVCDTMSEGVTVKHVKTVKIDGEKIPINKVAQGLGRPLRLYPGDPTRPATFVFTLIVDDTKKNRYGEDTPEITPESKKRAAKVMLALHLVDDKALQDRLVYPDSDGGAAKSHPVRTFASPYEKLKLDGEDWVNAGLVRDFLDQTKKEFRFLTGRPYDGVHPSPETDAWKAVVDNPWFEQIEKNPNPSLYGSARTIVLGTNFPTSFDAANAVDDFYRREKIARPTNFGINEHYREKDPNLNSKTLYPGKVSKAPSRSSTKKVKTEDGAEEVLVQSWRGFVHVNTLNEDGATRDYKVSRNLPTEEEAIRAHDALADRYGLQDRMEFPGEKLRYDLIVLKKNRGSKHRGVELDRVYEHVPEKRFWAYATNPRGEIIPLGHFADEEVAALKVREMEAMLLAARPGGSAAEVEGESEGGAPPAQAPSPESPRPRY